GFSRDWSSDVCSSDLSMLDRLRESTPEGLLEMRRVPGLGTSKIHAIHEQLGVETLHDLEQAARDGRLADLPRFGPKTAEKILKGDRKSTRLNSSHVKI